MLEVRLNELMGKSLSEIRAMPQSSSVETIDDRGRPVEVVTWCDQVAQDKYRVVVSAHRRWILGFSSVVGAEGFIVDGGGTFERMASSQARAVLR